MGSSLSEAVSEVVLRYLAGDARLDEVYCVLDPILHKMAREIARQNPEDAIQEARLKIWRVMDEGKVRTETLADRRTVCRLLLTAGSNAMKTFVKKHIIKHDGHLDVETVALSGPVSVNGDWGFDEDDLMSMYLDHIRKTGSMRGAHAAVAKRLGVTTSGMSNRFHVRAREYLNKHGYDIFRRCRGIDLD